MKKWILILGMLCFGWSFALGAADSVKAPGFSLKDSQGQTVNSDAFIGKHPTLITFWASW